MHTEIDHIPNAGDICVDRRFPQPATAATLRASVIIPAYNAEGHLAGCLEALMRQDFSPECFEVIVVDDGSTDGTPEVLKRFGQGSVRLRSFRQVNQGPAAARNHGARVAVGEILLFTDSDCTPEPDWVSQMLQPFAANPGITAAKGVYKTRQTSPVALFAQLEFEERYRKLSKHAEIDFVDTYAMAIKAEAFHAIGEFDTSFPSANNEDVEFSYRMARLGHRIVFNPQAVVYHRHPDTLFKYLKVKFGRAYWRMAVYRSFPEKMGSDSYTPQALKLQIVAAFLTAAAVLAGGGRTAAIAGGILFLLLCIPFMAGTFHWGAIERAETYLVLQIRRGIFRKIASAMASWRLVKALGAVVSGLAQACFSVLLGLCRAAGWVWRSAPMRFLRAGISGLFRLIAAAYVQTIRLGIRIVRLFFRAVAGTFRALGRAAGCVARFPGVRKTGECLGALVRSPAGMFLLSTAMLLLRAVVMGLGMLRGLQGQGDSKGRFSQLIVSLCADLVGLSIALIATPYVIHYLLGGLGTEPALLVTRHLRELPFVLLIALTVFALSGLYKSSRGLSQINEFAILTKAVAVVGIIGYATATLASSTPSFRFMGVVSVLALALLYLLRNWGRSLVKCLPVSAGEDDRMPVLIVGTGEVAGLIYNKLLANSGMEARVVGMVAEDPSAAGSSVAGCPVIGGFDDISRIISERHVKDVFVALPTLPQEVVLDIVHHHSGKAGVRFHVVATLCDLISAEVDMAASDTIPIIHMKNESMALLQMAVKRLFDIGVAFVVLALTLPFWLFIIIAIKLDSEGPAIFIQERVGKNGRLFHILKFRTMYTDADRQAYSPSSAGDKRITKVGAFLRKTSLDEFPQLLNVLRGDMSLVGPRPEMPFIVAGYTDWQRQRLKVKPGITGLWQIMGRKDLPLHENIEYDFYYIKNQSLLLDLSILIKTIPVILRRDGAY